MKRRDMLLGLSSAALVGSIGCTNPKASKIAKHKFATEKAPESPRQKNWRVEMASAITSQPIEFDPVTIGLLVELLWQLFQACVLNKLLAQHRAINKNPKGKLAGRWKKNVAQAFTEKNPGIASAELDSHVNAAFDAFRKASEPELTEAFRGIQSQAVELTDDDWNRLSRVVDAQE